jgi:fibronectin type 3 domain-containing protein
MYALADNAPSATSMNSLPYADPGALNDVTSGSNGTCSVAYLCNGEVGYDAPTGLGTPNGVAAFSGVPAVPVVPSAPLNLAATGANGSVSLTWSPPSSNGGSLITGYDIYRGTSAGGESTTPLNTSPVTSTNYTDTTVTNGTPYYYVVTAINIAGSSTISTEATATPEAPVIPSAPLNLAATGANGSVTLTWSPPSSNGGSTITGYDIYRGTSSGGESATPLNATPVTGTTYTDSAVTNGTPYYYVVTAINIAGSSTISAEAHATPTAATVPGAPTKLVVTGSRQGESLSWSAPSSNGGSAITVYQVYRSTASGKETLYATFTCSTATCSASDTGARFGTTYYYEVAATNSVGTGAKSNQASARAQ